MSEAEKLIHVFGLLTRAFFDLNMTALESLRYVAKNLDEEILSSGSGQKKK